MRMRLIKYFIIAVGFLFSKALIVLLGVILIFKNK
jgi:hypothetical protein